MKCAKFTIACKPKYTFSWVHDKINAQLYWSGMFTNFTSFSTFTFISQFLSIVPMVKFIIFSLHHILYFYPVIPLSLSRRLKKQLIWARWDLLLTMGKWLLSDQCKYQQNLSNSCFKDKAIFIIHLLLKCCFTLILDCLLQYLIIHFTHCQVMKWNNSPNNDLI